MAVTFDDVAAELSTMTGRRVGFIPVSDADAREQLVARGAPVWFADNVVAQFALLRGGSQTRVLDSVRRITGREPRSLADFLRDFGASFQQRAF